MVRAGEPEKKKEQGEKFTLMPHTELVQVFPWTEEPDGLQSIGTQMNDNTL